MTRIDRSPEQLDAEAAAPEDRDIESAISLHRALFRADLDWVLKLHQRDGDDAGLGPPFSEPFAAYLDGQLFENLSHRLGSFPYSKALFSLRQTCRSMHRPKHTDRDEWQGALCHTLVSLVIRAEYSVDGARLQLGLPDAGKTRRTLDNALLSIERHMERMADDQSREHRSEQARPPAEWMSEEYHQRHDQPGMHQLDCPKCIRERAQAA